MATGIPSFADAADIRVDEVMREMSACGVPWDAELKS